MTPTCSDAFAIDSEHPNYYSKHFKHVLEERKKTFFKQHKKLYTARKTFFATFFGIKVQKMFKCIGIPL